jgi:hypothetical protein
VAITVRKEPRASAASSPSHYVVMSVAIQPGRTALAWMPSAAQAAAERLERGYLGSLLRLAVLAPEIVESILSGRSAANLMRPQLMEPIPTTWAERREALAP